MITAMATMTGIIFLTLLAMLGIQISNNRKDRLMYQAEIEKLHLRLSSRTVGEYAEAVHILETKPDEPVTSEERRESLTEYIERESDLCRVD